MIDFSCNLTGRGWIDATLLDENDNSETITASYLSDGPYDLIIALALICEGINETMCLWNDEPRAYQWNFKRIDNILKIKIFQSEQTFKTPNIEKDNIVFSSQENLSRFVNRVLREFNLIKTEYTTEGYKNLWGYEFPLQALNRLNIAAKSLNR